MEIIVSSTVRDGDRITVSAQFVFDANNTTPEEAESIVKGFTAPSKAAAARLAAIHLTEGERKIMQQIGVSPELYFRYNPITR